MFYLTICFFLGWETRMETCEVDQVLELIYLFVFFLSFPLVGFFRNTNLKVDHELVHYREPGR